MNEERDFESHFAALREKFRERLAVYSHQLTAERQAFAASPNNDIVQRLRSLAHTLHGTAGTFGHVDVSDAAADLEAAADEVLGGSAESASVIAPLRRLIREVELAL